MAGHSKGDEVLRQQDISLKKPRMRVSAISRETNRSKSAISRILKLHGETGSFAFPRQPGRPQKTTPRQDRMMHRHSTSDRFNTASGIECQANRDFGMGVSQ